MNLDTITILSSLGPVLTKTFLAGGTVKNYDRARNFNHKVVSVGGLTALKLILEGVANDPTACVIRGLPKPGLPQPAERDLDNFIETPHHWVCIDIDDYVCDPALSLVERAQACVRDRLPEAFHDVDFIVQASSSYGTPGNEAKLKAHLWFWFDRPIGREELEAYVDWQLRDEHGRPRIDVTTLRTVQVHYVANPIFEDMTQDPLLGHPRLELVEGWAGEYVTIPNVPPEYTEARRQRQRTDGGYVDPREKPGLVGAFCRHVGDIRNCIDLYLPEHFDDGSEPHRLTWMGGNSPEGAYITSDEQALVITNSSFVASEQRMNAFDAVRLLMFGHLDGPYAPGVDVTTLPSYAAMVAWVRGLPELAGIVAEIDAARAGVDADAALAAFDDAEEAAPVQDSQPVAMTAQSAARSRKMADAQASVAAVASPFDLERLAKDTLAGDDWTDIEREDLANKLKQRFAALGTRVPIQHCRKLLAQPQVQAGFGDVDANGNPKDTLENFEQLLQLGGIQVSVNLMNQDLRATQGGAALDSDRVMAEVASLANRHNFARSNPGSVRSWVLQIARKSAINPPLEWIHSKPWDGVSRIQTLCDTLAVDHDQERFRDFFMRKWLLQAVHMLGNDGDRQARGVLLLSGPQYIGKTRWVRSLAPEFAAACSTSDVSDKDTVMLATRHWIVELPEVEAVLRRSDKETLKAFLNKQEDEYRAPYEPKASKYPRRTVYVATANGTELLDDHTGNTRMWPLLVQKMDHNHGIDMQQLWAEVAVLLKTEKPWMTPDEMDAYLPEASGQFYVENPWYEDLSSDWAWPNADVADRQASGWARWTASKVAELYGRGRDSAAVREVGRALSRLAADKERAGFGKIKSISRGRSTYWLPPMKDKLARRM